jgi:hypothetical protein
LTFETSSNRAENPKVPPPSDPPESKEKDGRHEPFVEE